MRFFVYILRSQKDGHLYIGMTHDLNTRVKAHNSGKVRSTKGRRPLTLVYQEAYEHKSEALKRERFLKSGQGRAFLKDQLSHKEG